MEERDNVNERATNGGDRPPEVATLEEQVASIKASLEEAEREKGQFKSLLQRTQADFQNYRKRVEAEREEHQKYAAARVLTRLIAIADDFQRALDQTDRTGPDAKNWMEGVKLIYRNIQTLLESEGISTIDAVGKPFDPSSHEAILLQETAAASEGTVVAIARQGYKLRDRILRPAQVVVAQKPQSQQSDNAQEASPDNSGSEGEQ